MAELLFLTALVTLVVLSIRRSVPVVLENPLIIHRLGKYHITLAPRLNRTQLFIQDIASRLSEIRPEIGSAPTQYFEVCDLVPASKVKNCYLLAVAIRHNVGYFQAIQSALSDDLAAERVKEIQAFSDAVLILHPLDGKVSNAAVSCLINTVVSAADKWPVDIRQLSFENTAIT